MLRKHRKGSGYNAGEDTDVEEDVEVYKRREKLYLRLSEEVEAHNGREKLYI
jgi:hypothetical protein